VKVNKYQIHLIQPVMMVSTELIGYAHTCKMWSYLSLVQTVW